MKIRAAFLLLVLAMLASTTLGGELSVTGVTLGGLAKAYAAGETLSFVDITSTSGVHGDAYAVQMQVQNTGNLPLAVQQVDVQVYAGIFDTYVPDGTGTMSADTTGVNASLPTLQPGDSWPNGGLSFVLPGTDFPETTSCVPYSVTLALNVTYTPQNSLNPNNPAVSEQDLVPMKVTPTCLSQTTSTTGTQAPASVAFASKLVETTDAALPFLINFGGKVLEPNPLKLFNVTGSNRTDVVYSVDEGLVYLMVYPPDTRRSASITVSVPAGAASTASGVPNGPASASAEYKPKIGAIRQAAVAMTAVFGGVVFASWATSFIVSCMQPWATAGSLGYGALAFILWAQKLYLSGLVATPAMPANYRTLSDTFAWADFQATLPWDWRSSGSGTLYRNNATTSGTIFESNAAVIMMASTYDLAYYSGPAGSTAPPPASPPAPAPPPPPTPFAPAPDLTAAIPVVTNPSPVPSPPADTGVPAAPTPSAGAVPAPDSCSVLQNSDFFGGDIANTQFQTTDPQACCNACLSNAACFVWTLSFVQNQCFLKGQSGWQQRENMTCCLSGTANRGGISTFLPGTAAPGPAIDAVSPSPDYASSNSNSNYCSNGKHKHKKRCQNSGRRLSSRTRRLLSNLGYDADDYGDAPGDGGRSLLQLLNANTSAAPAVVAPSTTRYVLVSTASGTLGMPTPTLVVVKDTDAWAKAKYVIAAGNPSDGLTVEGKQDVYAALKEVGFWFGCLMALVVVFNLGCLLFVNCCQGEVPGAPRMPLMVVMFVLSALAYCGGALFSGSYGLVPMCVGIAVVVCGPLLFILASYIGVSAALYRKHKAVYLLSSRANPEDPADQSKWDMRVVAGWMGMSLNRGKWRPSDPARKNEFVFRWGPLFEDCRGPLYQRRKITAEAGPSMSLRRIHTSSASDVSSQSGGANDLSPTSNRSRRKVVAVEEKAMAVCCRHKVRRSGFQAFGVIISLTRMCAYALAIAALWRWPRVQAGVLLLLSVAYLGYLRLVVPCSRRDEMALEYFNAFLDVILFALVLVLAIGGASTSVASIDSLGIGLIVVQIMGFATYLLNRMLIIVHAFSEVVCPGCTCSAAPSPKRKRRRRHSGIPRDDSLSLSMTSDGLGPQASYTSDGKSYFVQDGMMVDAKPDLDAVPAPGNGDVNGNGSCYAPRVMPSPSRSTRSAGPGMFPAIEEETDSQVGSPAVRNLDPAAPFSQVPANQRKAEEPEPPQNAAGRAAFRLEDQVGFSASQELPLTDGRAGSKGGGQRDVFDKFWKSL